MCVKNALKYSTQTIVTEDIGYRPWIPCTGNKHHGPFYRPAKEKTHRRLHREVKQSFVQQGQKSLCHGQLKDSKEGHGVRLSSVFLWVTTCVIQLLSWGACYFPGLGQNRPPVFRPFESRLEDTSSRIERWKPDSSPFFIHHFMKL